MSQPDDAPLQPDGPTPAREQLPLPRRRRQSHLEPQLRVPGSPGTGTPFTPFTSFSAETTDEIPATSPGRGEPPADRAAAFRAGARRGGSAARPRRGPGPPRTER